jgi:hypothetical protein
MLSGRREVGRVLKAVGGRFKGWYSIRFQPLQKNAPSPPPPSPLSSSADNGGNGKASGTDTPTSSSSGDGDETGARVQAEVLQVRGCVWVSVCVIVCVWGGGSLGVCI